MRLHSSEKRYAVNPRSAQSCTSSGQRWKESQASPLGSWQGDVGSCSHVHQSLFQLPPSTWCAAVAVPQTKPSGNLMGPSRGSRSGDEIELDQRRRWHRHREPECELRLWHAAARITSNRESPRGESGISERRIRNRQAENAACHGRGRGAYRGAMAPGLPAGPGAAGPVDADAAAAHAVGEILAMISIVIPAYQEEGRIGSTLRAIAGTVAHEVVVVANGCTDGTAAAAKRAGARVIETPIANASHARNLGAGDTIGDVLLFLDADTQLGAGTLDAIAAA